MHPSQVTRTVVIQGMTVIARVYHYLRSLTRPQQCLAPVLFGSVRAAEMAFEDDDPTAVQPVGVLFIAVILGGHARHLEHRLTIVAQPRTYIEGLQGAVAQSKQREVHTVGILFL